MFLSIVKNNKLHHFVRFNCMQVCAASLRAALWACLHAWLASKQPLGSASSLLPLALGPHAHRRLLPAPRPPPYCTATALLQAIMLDIVVMLFHILRAYLPSEVKWSILGNYFDMFGWTCCMATVLYAVFWTVRCGAGGGAGGWRVVVWGCCLRWVGPGVGREAEACAHDVSA